MSASKPTTPARRLDPEATRAAILEAATRLFLEKGFAKVSLSDIARASGVTKSLIHHHFGAKDELWQAIKRARFAEYAERQQALFADGDDPSNLLRRSVVEYFRYLQRHPDYLRLRAWMALEGDDACDDLEISLAREGIAHIRAAQEHGLVRADVDAAHILSAFLGLASQWFSSRSAFCAWEDRREDDPSLDEAYLEDMLEIFFRGVEAR